MNQPAMLADQALQKLIDAYAFATVLDVGCGDGLHSEEFRRAGKQVTGIDYRPRRAGVITADYVEHKFDRPFDCIWASHVLEHQPNVQLFLHKLFEDLKVGGVLAMQLNPVRSSPAPAVTVTTLVSPAISVPTATSNWASSRSKMPVGAVFETLISSSSGAMLGAALAIRSDMPASLLCRSLIDSNASRYRSSFTRSLPSSRAAKHLVVGHIRQDPHGLALAKSEWQLIRRCRVPLAAASV